MEGNHNVHSRRACTVDALNNVHGSNFPSLLFSNSVYVTAAAAATAVGGGDGGDGSGDVYESFLWWKNS